MRPTAVKAQKLAPGAPGILHPETLWGLYCLCYFVYFLHVTDIFILLMRLFGPPADDVSVGEYGFMQAWEML